MTPPTAVHDDARTLSNFQRSRYSSNRVGSRAHHRLDFAHVGLGGKQTNLSQPKLFMRNLYERCDVRFESKADICDAKSHVLFTPNNDVDCVSRHVSFGPIADMA